KVAGQVLIFNFSKPGRFIVNLRVFDGQLNASTTLLIRVFTLQTKTEINWIPLLILGLVAAGSSGLAVRYYIVARRKEGIPIVDEAFMVYDDGCLIAHVSKQERKVIDDDVLTGMLTAVQEFVKDSFKEEEKWTLRKLEFGQKNILIERGTKIYVAVIYRGDASKELTDKMAEIVSRMETEHSAELMNWNGKTENLKDAKDKLNEIMAIGKNGEENSTSVFPWLRKDKDTEVKRKREERNRDSLVFRKGNGNTVGLSNGEYRNGKINSSAENDDGIKSKNGLAHGLDIGNDLDNISMNKGSEIDKDDLAKVQEDKKPNQKEMKEVTLQSNSIQEETKSEIKPHAESPKSGTKEKNSSTADKEKMKDKKDADLSRYKPRMEYIDDNVDDNEDLPGEYPIDKIDSFIILEKGCYFVHGSQKYARKIFTNMLTFGAKGLLITDDPKEFLEEIAGEEVRLIWLGNEEGQVDPADFEKIKKIIVGYVKENKGATVLIENSKINEEKIEMFAKCIGEIKGNVTSYDAKLVLFVPEEIKGKGIEEICKVAQRLDEI
ncbi:MAG: DUF835 domain-containing protein, partial [Thermoplasmata archaeon]